MSSKIFQLTEILPPSVIAALLAIPLALPEVRGYETNPAFLLAPFVALALALSRDRIAIAFDLSILGGILSILIASYQHPDGRLLKDFLSLLLLVFSAGFYFLGRQIKNPTSFIDWLTGFSAIFIIAIAVRLFINKQPIHVIIDDYSYLNAWFFGWPIFASFGVNALVHLICIQAALFCAAIFATQQRVYRTAIYLVALGCSAFMIVGSDSRSSLVFLLLLLPIVGMYAFYKKVRWNIVVALLLSLGIGSALAIVRSPTENRFIESMSDVIIALEKKEANNSSSSKTPKNDEHKAESAQPERRLTLDEKGILRTKNSPYTNIDAVVSGRITHIKLAVKEILASPIIGSGFSPFGRYVPVDPRLKLSSTSHIYYLTILWKGGLLFAVPFFAFLIFATMVVIKAQTWRLSPQCMFALIAVVLTFGPISFTYDTPNVPSAGALAYLLLGALSRDERRACEDVCAKKQPVASAS